MLPATKLTLVPWAATCVLLSLFVPLWADAPASPTEEPHSAEAADEERKKDLLNKMKALEPKLPRELTRQLIIISMKMLTGWCSPYLAKDFEAEIDKLPEQQRKSFEKEWKAVREHEAWPTVIMRKRIDASSGNQ